MRNIYVWLVWPYGEQSTPSQDILPTSREINNSHLPWSQHHGFSKHDLGECNQYLYTVQFSGQSCSPRTLPPSPASPTPSSRWCSPLGWRSHSDTENSQTLLAAEIKTGSAYLVERNPVPVTEKSPLVNLHCVDESEVLACIEGPGVQEGDDGVEAGEEQVFSYFLWEDRKGEMWGDRFVIWLAQTAVGRVLVLVHTQSVIVIICHIGLKQDPVSPGWGSLMLWCEVSGPWYLYISQEKPCLSWEIYCWGCFTPALRS